MRCQFCGWDNPQDKETCEKCNKPLSGTSFSPSREPANYEQDNSARPTERMEEGGFNPKATVRESMTTDFKVASDENECPECGYYLENGECAACGYNVRNAKKSPQPSVPAEAKKTMRPIRKSEKKSEFKLIPISEETGLPEGDALTYEGKEIVLNRDNTDPENHTITSLSQATIELENGVWSIKDQSEYKTTFVQAARKIVLQPGDLILLGTQLYRFES